MRYTFGEAIAKLAQEDPDLYLIVGDIGYKVFDKFRAQFPNRFINIGICEQSMIGVAAGMALEGLKPWVYTITPFLIERPFEQVKLDIDQQNVNVKLVGYADYPKQGPTHSELNGKILMGLLKNTHTFFPKNGKETEQFVKAAHNHIGPVFISLKEDKNRVK